MAKTVDEIAQLAGVSVTSVRLVINGQYKKYRISEKTHRKIQDIIDEHGFVINQTARSLKLKKTQTLGLVVPHLTNPFFSSMAEKLERNCRDAGYQLITVCSEDDDDLHQEVISNLLARDVDGLFITPSSDRAQQTLTRNMNKPVVFLDRDFGSSSYPTVITDNEAGGIMLGERLAALRCELFFLGANHSLPTVQARLRGLTKGLAAHGYTLSDNEILFLGKSEKASGYVMMKQVCQISGKLPDAIVTISLPVLEGAMAYLREHYGAERSKVVIGSFDYHSMLEFCPNRVIAIKQDTSGITDHAMSLMKKQIEHLAIDAPLQVIAPELTELTSSDQ